MSVELILSRVSKYVPTQKEVTSVVVTVDIQQMAACVLVSTLNHYQSIIVYETTLNFVDNIECDNNPPPCEDVCTNTVGSYQCSCSDTSTSVTEDGHCIGIV